MTPLFGILDLKYFLWFSGASEFTRYIQPQQKSHQHINADVWGICPSVSSPAAGIYVPAIVRWRLTRMAPSTACAATGLTLSFNQGMIVK